MLVNAANESLAGAQLPYFPRGGPCPPPLPEGLDNANSWGALETGPGFVFREQAVDGVVTSLGGPALRDLCARARPDGFGAGSAVATAAPGLPFETVVHAVAPFWESASWRADLLRAYAAAFALTAGRDVATPLLGAGARGAPVADASAAAAAGAPPRRRHLARRTACPSASSTTGLRRGRNACCLLYLKNTGRHRKKGTSACAFTARPNRGRAGIFGRLPAPARQVWWRRPRVESAALIAGAASVRPP